MERRRPRQPPARPLVLLVDGHDDTRELYVLALEFLGFQTVIADDAEDAFLRAWETHPDIIVTEVSLVPVDGWHLVQDLKRDPRTRDIPVVVLTGHAQASVRERAQREGCAALFVKPCLPDQLAVGLRDTLSRHFSHVHTWVGGG
jgi:CheY-like chemotaxis protein